MAHLIFHIEGWNTPFREVLEEVHLIRFRNTQNISMKYYRVACFMLNTEIQLIIQWIQQIVHEENMQRNANRPQFMESGSKINWGHAANGNVNKRDSYISITSPIC